MSNLASKVEFIAALSKYEAAFMAWLATTLAGRDAQPALVELETARAGLIGFFNLSD